jgi:hypothetical protein
MMRNPNYDGISFLVSFFFSFKQASKQASFETLKKKTMMGVGRGEKRA